MILKVDSLQSG